MELGLQHRVRFLGHRQADVAADLAAIADIGVCLRRPPTGGETPAALMDLLRLGVPTIVSDVGPFSCYPDSVVRKHRWDQDGLAGLTQALRELAEDRPRREALGCAALALRPPEPCWPARPTRMKRSSSEPSRDGPGPKPMGPRRCRARRSSPRRNGSRPHRETGRPPACGIARPAGTSDKSPSPTLLGES